MSLTDFSDIFKSLPPHWLVLILVLVAFGIYWKKSNFSNRWYGEANLLLGMVLYTMFEIGISDEPFHLYREPFIVLPIYGLVAALLAVVAHGMIIKVLKAKFPSIEWPDDEPAKPATPSPSAPEPPKTP